MGDKTGIEWTDHTFNPWIGCTKVSPGCANCYAKTMDDRGLWGEKSHWGAAAQRRRMGESYWKMPYHWARQARMRGVSAMVFTASLADIFDSNAPVIDRRRLWNVIRETCQYLDWQILTKRPERIQDVMDDDQLESSFFERNGCWLMTSVENQAAADLRIPELLQVRARVHGISAEPLLGELDLATLPSASGIGRYLDALSNAGADPGALIPSKLDWVICGGESGPGARPMHPDWARSLRDDCADAGVPFFFKQWGEWLPSMQNGSLNAKGGEPLNCSDQPIRIGKHDAGSQLDGVEYKQFPAIHAEVRS